jgi:hypothetical protein
MQRLRWDTFTRAALCALALSCWPAEGQNPPAPQILVITTTTIKPDMRVPYEAYQKELTAIYKKAGVPMRSVWQTVMGDLTEYVSVYPIKDFGAFDEPTPVAKVVGQEKATELLKRGGQYLTSVHRGILFAQPDLSIAPKEGGGPTQSGYAVISWLVPTAGRSAELEHWIKAEAVPADRQGGAKQRWTYLAFFDGTPSYVTVYPLDNMAALNAGPPSWKMDGGRAAAEKMAGRLNGIVSDQKLGISRYRADLSYQQ